MIGYLSSVECHKSLIRITVEDVQYISGSFPIWILRCSHQEQPHGRRLLLDHDNVLGIFKHSSITLDLLLNMDLFLERFRSGLDSDWIRNLVLDV